MKRGIIGGTVELPVSYEDINRLVALKSILSVKLTPNPDSTDTNIYLEIYDEKA